MRSLDHAREVCEQHHPGLVKALSALTSEQRERPGSPAIDLFRSHGGVGLLVPRAFGGQGACPLDAVRVQEALGALSPSLAAAVAMHHFTAAMLFALAGDQHRLSVAQSAYLRDIVPGRRLMASGWAEGRTQQNILAPAVTAIAVPGGYLLSGSKKPCSLSRSMDLLTASISVAGEDGKQVLALALVPGDAPGLTVHPFWGNDLLAAAESDEVELHDVFVPTDLVIRTSADDPRRVDDLQNAGFTWFELLISAGYAGACAALVEVVLDCKKGTEAERASLALRMEAALALLAGAARAIDDGVAGEDAVSAVLVARYAVQDELASIAPRALELLGGLDFIRSSEHARLAGAVRPLAFHPPARSAASGPLLRHFAGGPLDLS